MSTEDSSPHRSRKGALRLSKEQDRSPKVAPTYFVYVLCSRNDRYLTVDSSASLVQGIRFTSAAIARRLGRKRVYQKLVYRERVDGLVRAVARCTALKALSGPALRRIIARSNPLLKPLSTRAGNTGRPRRRSAPDALDDPRFPVTPGRSPNQDPRPARCRK